MDHGHVWDSLLSWAKWAASEGENGPDEATGEYSRLPWILRGMSVLRALPLDDVRFVALMAVVFSVLAFFGNLVTQYNVEEEEDPEDLGRKAAERFMFSLTTLHLLKEEKPKWISSELVDRMIEMFEVDLIRSVPEASDMADDGSVLVDLLALLQFNRQNHDALAERCHRYFEEFRTSVDEVSRSEALRTAKILLHGPETPRNLFLEDDQFNIVVDFLTKNVLVCLHNGDTEMGDIFNHVVDLENKNFVSVDTDDGEILIVSRLYNLAQALFEKEISGKRSDVDDDGGFRISNVMERFSDFKLCFVGHGIAGSIASTLAVLVRSASGSRSSTGWLLTDSSRSCTAVTFGALPVFLYGEDWDCSYVKNFANEGDPFVRLSDIHVEAVEIYFTSVRMAMPPSERVDCLLEEPSSMATLHTHINQNILGAIESGARERRGLLHTGSVFWLSNGWYKIPASKFLEIGLLDGSHAVLEAHDLSAYLIRLREVE